MCIDLPDRCGSRLLKTWLSKPLVDRTLLQDRLDAVEEIMTSSADGIVLLQQSLDRMPDFARALSRVAYGQVCHFP